MHCGVSTSEDFDLLLGVEYLFAIGTTICMWEERLLYRVTYWEHGSPLAELPVRFVKREPREAYQVVERPLEEELGILTWKEMGKMEAARKQYEEIWGVSDNSNAAGAVWRDSNGLGGGAEGRTYSVQVLVRGQQRGGESDGLAPHQAVEGPVPRAAHGGSGGERSGMVMQRSGGD
ncbi:unnamed protein product [Closterium sp. NIES-53]